jgi:hypothetical protein
VNQFNLIVLVGEFHSDHLVAAEAILVALKLKVQVNGSNSLVEI